MNSQLSIINYLSIPQRCLINQKITKKTLLENAHLKASYKKVVREHIHEMFVIASITPQTANINTFIDENFSFDEVLILFVTLKKQDSNIKSAELLQSAIPYHLLIIFQYEDEFCFNIAEKRINQIDKEKRVVAEYTITRWFKENDKILIQFLKSISFQNLSHLDLKSFYSDLITRIYNLKSSAITGAYQTKTTDKTNEDIVFLKQIKQINEQIVSLRNAFKKETNFNEKVNLNVKIKKLEMQKEKLKQLIIEN